MTTAAPVQQRTLITVPLDRVEDNPWQPRAALTGIDELAADIAARGLDQMPAVRLAPGAGVIDGPYQLVYGHRRVAALRSLGWPECELELRDLTDEQMAVAALSENVQRKDLTPIETYRAWAKALEIDGMTVEKLATSLGLDRSTVSNNLRVLRLPRQVLDYVDSGDLSAHGAREFLCLMGEDGHFHEEIARTVLSRLTNGAPDWRVARVRYLLNEAILQRPVGDWRQLFDGAPGGSHRNPPKFDPVVFSSAHPAQVHRVPDDEWSSYGTNGKVTKERARDWTCATSAWVRAQKAAETAPAAAGAKGASKPEAKPGASREFAKTLKADPVFKAADLPVKFGKDGGVSWETELEDDVAEQLGTRAKPVTIERKQWRAVVDERQPNYSDYPGYAWSEGNTAIPSYFAGIDECRERCTIGATLARFKPDGRFFLTCLNREHFYQKVAEGRAAIDARLERKLKTTDDMDASVLGLLEQTGAFAGSDAYLRLVAGVLLRGAVYNALQPEGVQWHEARELARWSANQKRIFEIVGSEGRTDSLAALPHLSPDELRELVNRLVINQVRNDKELLGLMAALQPSESAADEPPAHLKHSKRTPAVAAAPP